jgi:hypothetical protein
VDGRIPCGLDAGIQFADLEELGTEVLYFGGGRVGRGRYASFMSTSASGRMGVGLGVCAGAGRVAAGAEGGGAGLAAAGAEGGGAGLVAALA